MRRITSVAQCDDIAEELIESGVKPMNIEVNRKGRYYTIEYFDGDEWNTIDKLGVKSVKSGLRANPVSQVMLVHHERQTINAKLSDVGLDGNGRFRSPGQVLTAAQEVLLEHGIGLGNDVDHYALQQESGKIAVSLYELVEQEDGIADPANFVDNAMLNIYWHRFSATNQYEGLAYVS